jgi:transcriptional regulator with XRE-family HTH domain
MTAAQIKAARNALGWTQRELAEKARINRRTVSNLEAGKHTPNSRTLLSIRQAFEVAGLEFVDAKPALSASK